LNFLYLFQNIASFQEGFQFEVPCRFYRTPQVSQREPAKGLREGLGAIDFCFRPG
jgi:hypothetical protein